MQRVRAREVSGIQPNKAQSESRNGGNSPRVLCVLSDLTGRLALRAGAATYVHVRCGRFTQIATYADRQKPVQS